VEVEYTKGCPCLIADEDLTKQIFEYSKEMMGEDKVIDMGKLTSGKKIAGSEDFAFFSEHVPTASVSVGAGSPAEGYLFPHHHPKIIFNEDALTIGAAVYANTAINWLKNNK
jgi:metal-dependent amidase/aminoacylase/carboxypeptidase family protein